MFLCTIFYKYASLTELPDIHDRMSRELKVDYEVSGLVLSATFIACVFGAIGFLHFYSWRSWPETATRGGSCDGSSTCKRARRWSSSPSLTSEPSTYS